MTNNHLPQFYREWITKNLGVTSSSGFAYYMGENYAYLIMGESRGAPGNLFIFVFRNPDKKEKRKQPECLKIHRIQALAVIIHHLSEIQENTYMLV